eukprot:gene12845-15179_t
MEAIELSLEARRECLMDPSSACPHLFTAMWDTRRCDRCGEHLSDARALSEGVLADEASAQDAANQNAARLHLRGVTAAWLTRFTTEHACWDWPTWQVVRDIVKPTTRSNRVRFVELEGMAEVAGRANVFVSHCWGAPWGTLVAAAVEGIVEDQRVWIDVFAVRQWPGNAADLDFDGVIAQSQAVLLVAAALPEVSSLEIIDINFHDARPSEDAKRLIAFFRVWCLVEMAAALAHSRPLVIKCGQHRIAQDKIVLPAFEADRDTLQRLLWLVRVEEAGATVEADRVRILQEVRDRPGGTVRLDVTIRGAIQGSLEASTQLQRAALGDPAALTEALAMAKDPQEVVCAAAAGGHTALLQELLQDGDREACSAVDAPPGDDADEWAPLHLAARGGHANTVRFLLELGAEVDVAAADGRTPLMLAAELGMVPAVEALLAAEPSPDLTLRDADGCTALLHAHGAAASGCEDVANALWDAAEVNPDGSPNVAGIQYYNTLIDLLIARSIEPVVTLYHWDLPQSLLQRYGGFLDRQIIADFTNYALVAFDNFADRVPTWITFNEPMTFVTLGCNVHAPGRCVDVNRDPYIAAHHVLLSHATVVREFRQKYAGQGGRIGMVMDADWSEPFSSAAADSQAAERRLLFQGSSLQLGWFADPLYFGDYPGEMRRRLQERLPRFTAEESTILT